MNLVILGTAASVVGWAANHIVASYNERHRQKLASQLEFTKKQLEELYAPLAFLVLEGQHSYDELRNTLGRSRIFEGHEPLAEDELKTWLFWAENDFLPRNEKISTLISDKTYLIDGGEVPGSWLVFVNHYNSWKVHHDRWKKENIQYSWHSRVPWPQSFEQDVNASFEALKERHFELIGRIVQ